MRKHLFKGKRLDNGEWVYGYLFMIWECAYTLWGTTNGIPNMIEVDPSTVCEFTGLTDKNGIDTFEHHLIKVYKHNGLYPEEWIEEVIFKNGMFGIEHGDLQKTFYPLISFRKILTTKYVPNFGEVGIEFETLFEIIGSIHDAPVESEGR